MTAHDQPSDTRSAGLAIPEGAAVDDQGFDFRPAWWAERVPHVAWVEPLERLPETGRGYHRVRRADLFDIARSSEANGAVLLACYAWGTGTGGFLVGRRARVFRDNGAEMIAQRLAAARELLAAEGPISAYASMLRNGSNYLKFLGPSFFTKYLYVVDAVDQAHVGPRALILDRLVAAAIRQRHDLPLSANGPWSPDQYEQWLAIAHDLADYGEGEGRLRGDQIEMAYFELGRTF